MIEDLEFAHRTPAGVSAHALDAVAYRWRFQPTQRGRCQRRPVLRATSACSRLRKQQWLLGTHRHYLGAMLRTSDLRSTEYIFVASRRHALPVVRVDHPYPGEFLELFHAPHTTVPLDNSQCLHRALDHCPGLYEARRTPAGTSSRLIAATSSASPRLPCFSV